MSCCGHHRSSSNGCCDPCFVRNINRFIGETVTIFTTSGGASGCGFTGVLIMVCDCTVRLVVEIGAPPTNPLSEVICGDMDNGQGGRGCGGQMSGRGNWNGVNRQVGSVVDIPVDRIAAFCHNALS